MGAEALLSKNIMNWIKIESIKLIIEEDLYPHE
jgi:hypothetical protein